ncbi:MAG TPA: nucleotidyltransferase family protein [Gaiellaceae bacterium]|nr:nucleotidyltransferase family protein [Gaiellaceae bacterium]
MRHTANSPSSSTAPRTETSELAAAGLWEGVDRVLETLSPETASEQKLGPLAARRLRLLGRPVPDRLAREDRAARAGALVAPALLARIREAYDGPLLLIKGPELANCYPDGARRLGDLDVVAADPERAQAALLSGGFRPKPTNLPADYARHHHLHPLQYPGLALPVEIHRRVMWPAGLRGPSNEELFEAAVPASVGVDGLLAPDPRHHALLLAAHAWGEVPMRNLREFVDVLALTNDAERGELRRLAREWDFEHGWTATLAAADWLLRDGAEPTFVRVWARHLRSLREPTVLEMHVQKWLSPFTLASPPVALRLSATAIVQDLRPGMSEGWRGKFLRIAHALPDAFSSRSAHERRSRERGIRPPRRTVGIGSRRPLD